LSTTKSILPEEELVKRLSNRDKQAFSYLYDNYSSALYGVIFRIVQDEEISQDVLQEAFVKIWHNFTSYDKEKGRLFTWMVNLARNLSIDKVRSKDFRNHSQNLSVDNAVNYIDGKKNTSFNPDHIGLKEILNKLKPDQREIIDLVYFMGYTQAETAEKLMIPIGTVKTKIRNAIIQLREII
jgi:RNA polymerase sigma factor (sigma-70 family)